MGFALSAGHVATRIYNLGLIVLVPCQELMTIGAGEWYPRERDAKTRQQECGEKKHGFLHPIPGSGHYLDLAHKHTEWRLASSVNAFGARGEAALDCLVLKNESTWVHNPGRKESPSKPGNPAELWERSASRDCLCHVALWICLGDMASVSSISQIGKCASLAAGLTRKAASSQTEGVFCSMSPLPISVGHLLQFPCF